MVVESEDLELELNLPRSLATWPGVTAPGTWTLVGKVQLLVPVFMFPPRGPSEGLTFTGCCLGWGKASLRGGDGLEET